MDSNPRREFITSLAAFTSTAAAATLAAAAPAQAQPAPNSPFVSVKDHGALGNWDGSTGADDTAALQGAINTAAKSKRRVYVPAGRYRITRPLVMKLGMVFEGESEYGSIVEQTKELPVFVNEPGHRDFCNTRISNITLRGGTYAHQYSLRGSQVQSIGEWERVRFELQTIRAIQCSQYFLINNFHHCVFHYCGGAIEVKKQANLNNFVACRFEGLSGNTVAFLTARGARGGEGNMFVGCRFEARHHPASDTDNTVFLLESCTNTLIESCYFEDTWKRILKETGAAIYNTTSLRNNKFSGQEVGVRPPGPKQELFVSDGMVTFDNNFFEVGTSSQCTCAVHLVGNNRGLNTGSLRMFRDACSADAGRVLTRPWTPASGVPVSLFEVSRTNTARDPTNISAVGGTVRITVSAVDTKGAPMFMSRAFPFLITASASETMTANFGAVIAADNNPAGGVVTLTEGTPSASSLTIQASLVGPLRVARVRADIEWQVSFNPPFPPPTVNILQ